MHPFPNIRPPLRNQTGQQRGQGTWVKQGPDVIIYYTGHVGGTDRDERYNNKRQIVDNVNNFFWGFIFNI
jgi:hypothetical protein